MIWYGLLLYFIYNGCPSEMMVTFMTSNAQYSRYGGSITIMESIKYFNFPKVFNALRKYSIDSAGLTFQESGCIKLRKYNDYRKSSSVMSFKLRVKHL
jgi:hypothetical protein